MKVVEICCGSYFDAKQAFLGGAKRIELNSALHLGGLTPTLSTLKLIKDEFELKVIAMVRPRGAGFCYSKDDFKVMIAECEMLVGNGSDGVAFGCLNEDATINIEQSRQMINIIKQYKKEAVFHRAFDCCKNPYETIEQLIDLGVDRVLTSGLKQKAVDGIDLLYELQGKYGEKIEILVGSGVNSQNAKMIIDKTGVSQVHSSCKSWEIDKTTLSKGVSYSFASSPNESCYDVVSKELVEKLIESIEK